MGKTSFTRRNVSRHRMHMVFSSVDQSFSGKPIRMHYMFHNGVEIGHAGVGVKDRCLYNVMVHEPFRNAKFGYRLMAYIMGLPERPLKLVARSTGGMSDAQLAGFYEQFGFHRVPHPVHRFYMEFKP